MPRPPNILLITGDDHAAAISCCGSVVVGVFLGEDGWFDDDPAYGAVADRLRDELIRQIRQVGDKPPASLDRLIEAVPAAGEDG